MPILIFLLGLTLAACGGSALYAGFDIVTTERGLAMTICGTLALCVGVVVIVIGFLSVALRAVTRRLDDLKAIWTELAAQPFPAEPEPMPANMQRPIPEMSLRDEPVIPGYQPPAREPPAKEPAREPARELSVRDEFAARDELTARDEFAARDDAPAREPGAISLPVIRPSVSSVRAPIDHEPAPHSEALAAGLAAVASSLALDAAQAAPQSVGRFGLPSRPEAGFGDFKTAAPQQEEAEVEALDLTPSLRIDKSPETASPDGLRAIRNIEELPPLPLLRSDLDRIGSAVQPEPEHPIAAPAPAEAEPSAYDIYGSEAEADPAGAMPPPAEPETPAEPAAGHAAESAHEAHHDHHDHHQEALNDDEAGIALLEPHAASHHVTSHAEPVEPVAEAPAKSEVIGSYESAGVVYMLFADGSVLAEADGRSEKYASLEALRRAFERGESLFSS